MQTRLFNLLVHLDLISVSLGPWNFSNNLTFKSKGSRFWYLEYELLKCRTDAVCFIVSLISLIFNKLLTSILWIVHILCNLYIKGGFTYSCNPNVEHNQILFSTKFNKLFLIHYCNLNQLTSTQLPLDGNCTNILRLNHF